MNPHRELFENYKKGVLEESRIGELHQYLIEQYFISPGELNRDEMEYTEDYIIEVFATGRLEEKYVKPLKLAISGNQTLSRKYRLLSELGNAREKAKNDKMSLLLSVENPEVEIKEEEQLAKILQEVIGKVHADKESGTVKAGLVNLIIKLKSFLLNLIPQLDIHQPRFRVALALASVAIVAIVVWISIHPGNKELISKNNASDSVRNKTLITPDSSQGKEIKLQQRIQLEIRRPEYAASGSAKNGHVIKGKHARKNEETDRSGALKIEMDPALLACAENIPASMEYEELRSMSSAANDLFVDAAIKYENKEYDSCLAVLKGLLKENYFKSPDTLNEINFYMGITYLKKGFNIRNQKLLKMSIQSFGRIEPPSSYFNDSRWYSALVTMRLGNITKGMQILDSLLQLNYLRSGEVKTLRDKMESKIHK